METFIVVPLVVFTGLGGLFVGMCFGLNTKSKSYEKALHKHYEAGFISGQEWQRNHIAERIHRLTLDELYKLRGSVLYKQRWRVGLRNFILRD